MPSDSSHHPQVVLRVLFTHHEFILHLSVNNVFLQLILDRHDFFPLNRALSLTNMDDDSTESKIDELLQYVLSLVQKQKEEVSSQI